jgi:hypothetical protein
MGDSEITDAQGSNDGVSIREDRGKAARRLIGCFAFVALGLWLIIEIPGRRPALGYATVSFAILAARYVWSLVRPGYLRISRSGIGQDLGWRRRFWEWDSIGRVEIYDNGRGARAALLYLQSGKFIRLFGWERTPPELVSLIDEYRPSGS